MGLFWVLFFFFGNICFEFLPILRGGKCDIDKTVLLRDNLKTFLWKDGLGLKVNKWVQIRPTRNTNDKLTETLKPHYLNLSLVSQSLVRTVTAKAEAPLSEDRETWRTWCWWTISRRRRLALELICLNWTSTPSVSLLEKLLAFQGNPNPNPNTSEMNRTCQKRIYKICCFGFKVLRVNV